MFPIISSEMTQRFSCGDNCVIFVEICEISREIWGSPCTDQTADLGVMRGPLRKESHHTMESRKGLLVIEESLKDREALPHQLDLLE